MHEWIAKYIFALLYIDRSRGWGEAMQRADSLVEKSFNLVSGVSKEKAFKTMADIGFSILDRKRKKE